MRNLILASNSPRRKQLLEQVNISFSVLPSEVDEVYDRLQNPIEIVKFLAEKKAHSIYEQNSDAVVIGSDTLVVLNGVILGKPIDENDAREMLKQLSGRTHSVITGVAIMSSEKQVTFAVETFVTFYELCDEEIEYYVQTMEPLDKAGAYGIQGIGAFLVKELKGDYFSVVGLPIARVVRELAQFGITPAVQ